VSYVDNSCVGCGVCGTNAHSAILCPSFSQIDLVYNPTRFERLCYGLRVRVRNWWRDRDLRLRERARL
jgi:indolepyruvate ferredoxin oxidoreductase alpha subunit